MRRTITLTLLMLAMTLSNAATEFAWSQDTVDFGKQIFPLFQQNCLACHHLKEPEGGLNLESFEAMMKGGSSGNTVVAGKSAESELLKRVLATDDSAMPPADNSVGAKKLTEAEIQLLRTWIDQGAARGTSPMAGTIQWSKVPSNLNPIYAVASSADGQYVAAGRANRVTFIDGHRSTARLRRPCSKTQPCNRRSVQTVLPARTWTWFSRLP